MAGATRRKTETTRSRRGRPAHTPEARENQLIAKAIDLTEKQIEEGTVSAQVLSHYIKLGSTRERLEQSRLKKENELLTARVEQLASAKKVEELYANALNAMRSYSGQDPIELEYDDDDEY